MAQETDGGSGVAGRRSFQWRRGAACVSVTPRGGVRFSGAAGRRAFQWRRGAACVSVAPRGGVRFSGAAGRRASRWRRGTAGVAGTPSRAARVVVLRGRPWRSGPAAMAFNPIHIIFGLKLRQARLARGLSITELSERSGLSPSYITEIEKGRKYPKADRIMDLAQALGYESDELVSLKLDPPLSFLETPLTSQLLKNFPLELFGVDPGVIIDVLTRSPAEMGALIRALQGIARGYAIRDEHFYLAALRSYQEHHQNYFPELEEAARRYSRERGWDDAPLPREEAVLTDVLRKDFGYDIDVIPVEKYPSLAAYRMIFQPAGPGGAGSPGATGRRARPRLLLNPALMPAQRQFLLAREIGYNVLGLDERALTNSPDRVESFAQVMNDFKAAYFGGALLMPEA